MTIWPANLLAQGFELEKKTDSDIRDQSCIPKGEEFAVYLNKGCCPGLIQTSRFQSLEGNCGKLAPPGDGGFCVKCGDGICEKDLFETPCLCPKDCHP